MDSLCDATGTFLLVVVSTSRHFNPTLSSRRIGLMPPRFNLCSSFRLLATGTWSKVRRYGNQFYKKAQLTSGKTRYSLQNSCCSRPTDLQRHPRSI